MGGCCSSPESPPNEKHERNAPERLQREPPRPIVLPEQVNQTEATRIIRTVFPKFFDDYELGEYIAEGHTGDTVVFRCVKKSSPNTPLCCKLWNRSPSDAEQLKEDTKQPEKEINALNSLVADDGIVEMTQVFKDGSYALIVMSYMVGGPLPVGKFRWPERIVSLIMQQILLLLEGMHEAGYCHLDVKPSHILLEHPLPSNLVQADYIKVRLAGFGCCTRFRPLIPSLADIPESPLWIAPEIWKIIADAPSCSYFDERCDLWSLGVVAYAMLSGRHPFSPKPLHCDNESVQVAVFEAIFRDTDNPVKFDPEAFEGVSHEARHFLLELLQVDFTSRSTAYQALHHPFIRMHSGNLSYLVGFRPRRIMFHFSPERADVDIKDIKPLVNVAPERGSETGRTRKQSWQTDDSGDFFFQEEVKLRKLRSNSDTGSPAVTSLKFDLPPDHPVNQPPKSPKYHALGSPVREQSLALLSPRLSQSPTQFPKEKCFKTTPENGPSENHINGVSDDVDGEEVPETSDIEDLVIGAPGIEMQSTVEDDETSRDLQRMASADEGLGSGSSKPRSPLEEKLLAKKRPSPLSMRVRSPPISSIPSPDIIRVSSSPLSDSIRSSFSDLKVTIPTL